jgi:alcohol dehydrogenase class IV
MLKKKRIFILSIQPVVDLIQPQLDKLKEAGIEILINISVTSEPTFNDFDRIIDEAKSFNPDSVAGIGGGSVMDMAKLIAAFIELHKPVKEFVGIGLLKERKIHLVCIPTTSGTGSEVSPNSILLDEKDGGKKGIISHVLIPDSSYIDPALTVGLPADLTAYTGIDAFTHCLEAYANKYAHPIVDTYALKGITLIHQNLPKAIKNGNDIEVRSNVALGSLYGGMCLGPVNTGAVHALAYPLGSDYKIAHGLSNALLLPYVLEYNIPEAYERYAEIAKAMGIKKNGPDMDIALEGLTEIKKLLKVCNIPEKLKEIGVKEDSVETMAKSAMNVQRLLKNNVKEVKLEDAIRIYQKAI